MTTIHMTEGECVANGGHCYEIADTVGASLPPTYWRICKHCGKRQQGHPRDSMEWYDI